MIRVLDRGYIDSITVWGSDSTVIEAARMSTGAGFKGWGNEEKPGDEKLLAYLYKHKHMTPFEMCGLTIEVMAPIMVFREWHRHRTQSYNEMSARYIPLPDINYVPDAENVSQRSIEAALSKNKQNRSYTDAAATPFGAKEWINKLQQYYDEGQQLYDEGLKLGIPKEIARLPVTVGRYSVMRASANLRNWLAFLTLRMDKTAQWEIRQYANAVGSIISHEFPRTWKLFEMGQ